MTRESTPHAPDTRLVRGFNTLSTPMRQEIFDYATGRTLVADLRMRHGSYTLSLASSMFQWINAADLNAKATSAAAYMVLHGFDMTDVEHRKPPRA